MNTYRVAAVLIVGVGLAVGPGNALAQEKSDDRGPVVAKVNDTSIYRNDVERAVASLVSGQKVDPDAIPTIQATMLQQMVGNSLLNEFLLSQKNLVTSSDVSTAMNQIRAEVRKQGGTMEQFLAQQRTTEQALMSQIEWQIMVQKYAASKTTEEGLKQYFEEHKELFDGTTRRASHVLLRPSSPTTDETGAKLVEQAKAIREQVESGQLSFSDAAAKHSFGPSRHRGGDVGFVPRSGVMEAAFSQTLYALELNEVSEPVATPFGIHLIKLTEIKPGEKTFDEVRGPVQQAYNQHLLKELVEELQAKANIEYLGNYPHFKPGTEEVVMPSGSGG